jgi:hypothetical protein
MPSFARSLPLFLTIKFGTLPETHRPRSYSAYIELIFILARTIPAPAASSSGRRPGSDAFPALPAAAKPTSTVFTPGYTGSGVRREHGAPTTANPWGGNNSNATTGSRSNEDSGPEQQKKRGNKNKKQTLFHFG